MRYQISQFYIEEHYSESLPQFVDTFFCSLMNPCLSLLLGCSFYTQSYHWPQKSWFCSTGCSAFSGRNVSLRIQVTSTKVSSKKSLWSLFSWNREMSYFKLLICFLCSKVNLKIGLRDLNSVSIQISHSIPALWELLDSNCTPLKSRWFL